MDKKFELNDKELGNVTGGWTLDYKYNEDENSAIVTFKLEDGDIPVQAVMQALAAYNVDPVYFAQQASQYLTKMTGGKFTTCTAKLTNLDAETRTATIADVSFS